MRDHFVRSGRYSGVQNEKTNSFSTNETRSSLPLRLLLLGLVAILKARYDATRSVPTEKRFTINGTVCIKISTAWSRDDSVRRIWMGKVI